MQCHYTSTIAQTVDLTLSYLSTISMRTRSSALNVIARKCAVYSPLLPSQASLEMAVAQATKILTPRRTAVVAVVVEVVAATNLTQSSQARSGSGATQSIHIHVREDISKLRNPNRNALA